MIVWLEHAALNRVRPVGRDTTKHLLVSCPRACERFDHATGFASDNRSVNGVRQGDMLRSDMTIELRHDVQWSQTWRLCRSAAGAASIESKKTQRDCH
jgi:hypothetical protein